MAREVSTATDLTLTAEEPAPRGVRTKRGDRLSKAGRDALITAYAHGRVYRRGQLGTPGERDPLFVRAITVDTLIRDGWLKPGKGFASLELTDKGHNRASSLSRRLSRKARKALVTSAAADASAAVAAHP